MSLVHAFAHVKAENDGLKTTLATLRWMLMSARPNEDIRSKALRILNEAPRARRRRSNTLIRREQLRLFAA